LCTGDAVSGVFDFYFSCTAPYVFDLMMTVNAWCFENGQPVRGKIVGLVQAYHAARPLSAAEKEALPLFGAAAALTFATERLRDWLKPRPGAKVTRLDPLELVHVMRWHRQARPDDYGLKA